MAKTNIICRHSKTDRMKKFNEYRNTKRASLRTCGNEFGWKLWTELRSRDSFSFVINFLSETATQWNPPNWKLSRSQQQSVSEITLGNNLPVNMVRLTNRQSKHYQVHQSDIRYTWCFHRSLSMADRTSTDFLWVMSGPGKLRTLIVVTHLASSLTEVDFMWETFNISVALVALAV